MILKTILFILVAAVALIALAVALTVLLGSRLGKSKHWIGRTAALCAVAIIALAVAGDAYVLVSAVWRPRDETAMEFSTPVPAFHATAVTTPPDREVSAPSTTERPVPGDLLALAASELLCDFQDSACANCNFYLRSYPAREASKLQLVREGTEFSRLGFTPEGWSKIVVDGQEGFGSCEWMDSVDRNENEVLIYNDTVSVQTAGTMYARPDDDSAGLSYAPVQTVFTRTGLTCDGWSEITFDGKVYYMRSELLSAD